MKLNVHLYAAATLLAAVTTIQADTVNMSLGASSQNFVLTGLGPIASGPDAGDGKYSITQGACTNSAGLTTCIMSGAITSSDHSAFGSGTYQFITTYATADVLPIQGFSSTPTSDSFYYDYFATDVNMTLVLSGTPSGTVSEALVTNGAFDTGTGFGFGYVSLVCAGLPVATPCSQANVGQVPGATTTGPVIISASFTIPDVTPTPEPTSLALMGSTLLGLGFLLRKKR